MKIPCVWYMHVYMYLCAKENILLGSVKDRYESWIFFISCSPFIFLRQSLSLTLGLINSTRRAARKLQGATCLCSPGLKLDTGCNSKPFIWMLGIWKDFRLMWQTFYPLNHFPSGKKRNSIFYLILFIKKS